MTDIANIVQSRFNQLCCIPPGLLAYVKEVAEMGNMYPESSQYDNQNYIVLKLEMLGKPADWVRFIVDFPTKFAEQTGACKTRKGTQSDNHNIHLLYFNDT